MIVAHRQENGSDVPRVLVSNAAANMISSLYPFDEAGARVELEKITSSVRDPARVRKIAGLDNAFVARSGRLRVIFKREGEAFIITSVVANSA